MNRSKTINCKGKLIDLSIPKVMGILNVTPDSFYDGGKTVEEKEILIQTEKMIENGATFIDVGGYSSRPGALKVTETEELLRVIPAIESINKNFDTFISIDTFRSSVAKKALETGAAMVNDISGGGDKRMLEIIAQFQVPYVLMHMRGKVQTMMDHTSYKNLTKEILLYFSEKIAAAREAGINDLIVDPGFGFSKTKEQNFELLNNLELLQHLETPILVGLSRKSMIYKTLDSEAKEALNGTTALNTVALNKGASILRVHDVKEAMECIKLMESLKIDS